MTDEKNPVEQALDVLLYAPLGLVFSARELLPTLAEKGRNQLGMFKMVGQFAAQQGQQEAEKRLVQVREQAVATLEQLAGSKANGAAPAAATKPAAEPASAPVEAIVVESPAEATPLTVATPNGGHGPEAAGLAIPDYDSLSASQVVPRLQGLAAEELEAVRAYEADHRGRKTILNRIAQLQS